MKCNYKLLTKITKTNEASTFFLMIKSQYPEYLKITCFDRNNPYQFACRRWIINQYSEKIVILAKTDNSLKDDIVIVSTDVLKNFTIE